MNKFLVGALILIFSSLNLSHAEEVSFIEADHMEWNEATGITEFRGSVRYRYPTEKITILSETLKIHRQGNQLVSLTAKGQPVQFEGLTDEANVVKGQSTHLHYDAQSEMVELNGDAQLQTGKDNLRGERITYNMQTQKAEASGDKTQGKRFEAVIHSSPEQKEPSK